MRLILIDIVLKPIFTPLLAMLLTDKFNPVEYISFIPDDNVYGFGLSIYMAVFELIYKLVFDFLEKHRVYVSCIFYISELDKNINNKPSAIHGEGVFKIQYEIKVSGNYKRLNKCKLVLYLNSILDVQSTDGFISEGDKLTYELDKLLNKSSGDIASRGKIYFIKNCKDDILLDLKPIISNKRGIKFETNGFKIHD